MTDSPIWSFKALGFQVNVQATFLVLLGIYALIMLSTQAPLASVITWPLVVLVSIVWHELGHATVARYLKVPVGNIELHAMGGHVTTGYSNARNQLAISLAGPFAGLALGGVAVAITAALGYADWWAVMWAGSWTQRIELILLSQFLFVNVLWSLVNLLPLRPLDGGNALLSFLQINLKDIRRATRYTAIVGMVTGVGIALWAYTSGWRLLPFLGLYFTYLNYQTYQQYRR